jgi:hypothetical protein
MGSRKVDKGGSRTGAESNQGSRKDAKTQRVKGMLRKGDVVGVFFAPWRLERSGREIRFVAHYRTPILNLA